jgi:hypothetical protein
MGIERDNVPYKASVNELVWLAQTMLGCNYVVVLGGVHQRRGAHQGRPV